MSSKIKTRLKEFLLFVVTLCLLTAGLEIWARNFTDIQPSVRQKDATIGYRYKRSSQQFVRDNESGRDIYMRFNDIGFRGRNFSRDKPENVTRIAFLGDSMIAALQVEEEDSMVSLLENMLNASDIDGDRRWEVMNFGVSGSSPGQSIAVWREEVIHFKPDIVLLGYFVGNDLANNCECLDKKKGRVYFDIEDDGVYRQQPHLDKQAVISKYLNENSAFYVWQKEAFRTLRKTLSGEIQDGQLIRTFKDGDWIYSAEENAVTAYAWRLTEEAVKTLHREVNSEGAQFAVILIPHGPQVYEDIFSELKSLRPDLADSLEADYPDRRLGQICQENDIPFLSMLTSFRAAAPQKHSSVKQELLFFHGGHGHFNELGNHTAALSVRQFIRQGPLAIE